MRNVVPRRESGARHMSFVLLSVVVLWLASPLSAQPPRPTETDPVETPTDQGTETETPTASAETLVARVKASIVEITTDHVAGGRRGVGAGFIISDEGLIATNLHVIGEGKRIRVETADGRVLSVKSVHASDRFLDLAVLQVETDEDIPLTPLPMAAGDETLSDGADLLVIGNPHGLRNSVVRGVLSARREIEGRPMLQLAIPIEPGNSGGPVLDMQGRVQGVVTMKSAVTDNLGFAMTTASLRSLLEKPNPVAYDNWLSIGRIDAREWTPLFGADWRQLGGRLLVRDPGKGFGGRALLLRTERPAQATFELGVAVKLDDESGAAGLVFHADGRQRHYGFYPSGGKLRFTCFDGPTVFNWRILHNESSPHYRPGEFNHLKVRVDGERIRCFVNHELVFETTDKSFTEGQVGLAKFRQTAAEFRLFEVGAEISARSTPEDLLQSVQNQIDSLQSLQRLSGDTLQSLADHDRVSVQMLKSESAKLRERAAELEKLADEVHSRAVIAKIKQLTDNDERFDLLRLALLIARLDDPTVDVEAYVRLVDRMGETITKRTRETNTSEEKIELLNQFLFRENGFHGSRTEYYHPSKRYMNRVLDDRNGIPIMLATLYMELGRRIGLPLEGVGLPGHFVVRVQDGPRDQLIDVFDGGAVIDRERAAELVAETTGGELRDDYLEASTHRQIGVRMMMNLGALANDNRDLEALHRYLSATLAIDPGLTQARLDRLRVRVMTGRRQLALEDLSRLQEETTDENALRGLLEMRNYLQSQPD